MPSTDKDGLAGPTEAAQIVGVSRQRLAILRRRDDFPKPVAELAGRPVWRVEDLRAFLEQWPRKPGRPRTTDR